MAGGCGKHSSNKLPQAHIVTYWPLASVGGFQYREKSALAIAIRHSREQSEWLKPKTLLASHHRLKPVAKRHEHRYN